MSKLFDKLAELGDIWVDIAMSGAGCILAALGIKRFLNK